MGLSHLAEIFCSQQNQQSAQEEVTAPWEGQDPSLWGTGQGLCFYQKPATHHHPHPNPMTWAYRSGEAGSHRTRSSCGWGTGFSSPFLEHA